MSNGIKLVLAIVVVLGVITAVVFLKPGGPKVTVPESGPVIVEEPIPANPDEKAAFDLRKAASACRVAIMQSAKDPTKVQFSDEIDQTPAVLEANGDYSFNIGVKAGTEAQPISRQVNCKAHREESGWSIAELSEAAK